MEGSWISQPILLEEMLEGIDRIATSINGRQNRIRGHWGEHKKGNPPAAMVAAKDGNRRGGWEALEPINQPTRKTRFFHSKLHSEHLHSPKMVKNFRRSFSAVSSWLFSNPWWHASRKTSYIVMLNQIMSS